ncbi:VpaChn25_0724 family phage protein [Pseudogemmobacter sonorensis]|uniref:VpaChn25_0724 family phage protein n=1 Tax=Pseudogemmobacter sonorensis TaxID=2989681 RepID=UPI00368B3AAC
MGVLPQMGIKVHWATPGHGQAKPIERSFRDLADDLARHPAFAGAYVGNRPDAKPEDYGSRAVPLADLLEVTEEVIAAHNARPGRLTDNARGRSFDDTFAESYAKSRIVKATAEQHRLWLMGQEVRKLQKHHGAFKLFENSYWADWMNEYVGQKVVARFDPEDLHAGLFIYSLSGEFLGPAECREKVGFFDLVGAKTAARLKRQRRAAEKKLLDLHRPISIDQWAAELREARRPETPLVETKVVELAPARTRKPVTLRRHRRLAILRFLGESPSYTSNESILTDMLNSNEIGIDTSRDQTKTELAWLAEMGLVQLVGCEEFRAATVTARGVDIALGRATHPEIQRPGAEGLTCRRPARSISCRPRSGHGFRRSCARAASASMRMWPRR